MTIITITNGLYSNSDEAITILAGKLNCSVIKDQDIIDVTSKDQGFKLKSLIKAVESKNMAFNDFTYEREKCIAGLKKTIAEYVARGNCIFHGNLGHLIPNWVSHVLKVLIITDKKHRILNGVQKENLSQEESEKNIDDADRTAILWTNALFEKKAWDKSLYDEVVPSDKMTCEEMADIIIENAGKVSDRSEAVIAGTNRDFVLAAVVDAALYRVGSYCTTNVHNNNVEVTIEKNVMMLSRLKRKIIEIVSGIKGVVSVTIRLGVNYYSTSATRKYEFETPTRILLVDDEKEFVHTLSERLKMREYESDVVYSGQDALDYTEDGNTEVMVLDLKMPGVDGFEVLKKVKASNPDTEVIILTGHGSEDDRKTCLELGAFAYLQKPADIDKLTMTMKEAYKKIDKRKELPVGA